jgi:hypothetical protein
MFSPSCASGPAATPAHESHSALHVLGFVAAALVITYFSAKKSRGTALYSLQAGGLPAGRMASPSRALHERREFPRHRRNDAFNGYDGHVFRPAGSRVSNGPAHRRRAAAQRGRYAIADVRVSPQPAPRPRHSSLLRFLVSTF